MVVFESKRILFYVRSLDNPALKKKIEVIMKDTFFLKRMMKAYCKKTDLVRSTVTFTFGRKIIVDTDTPLSLAMRNGDIIHVFQQRSKIRVFV